MAFVKAKIEIKPASVGTGLKCQLRRGKNAGALLSFTINATVGAVMSLSDKDRIEVMIGDGEHHGLIRLRKNNSVGDAVAEHRETHKGAWFTIRLGHQPVFVDRSEPSSWCQWERIEDGWVEIVLPKWADETAPRKQAVAKAPSAQPPQPARKAVTGQLMGDPPAGRREMLEKMGNMKP